jgi:hypothetical protein
VRAQPKRAHQTIVDDERADLRRSGLVLADASAVELFDNAHRSVLKSADRILVVWLQIRLDVLFVLVAVEFVRSALGALKCIRAPPYRQI